MPDKQTQKKYLNHLKDIVVENLDNAQFGVEGLAEAAGISRSQLHRKLKRMLQKTVNDFIREVRLDEALKLLEIEELTAAEISYRVGFSSPSYFNKCFHDHFGYTPGEVKKMLEEGLALSEIELKNNVLEGEQQSLTTKPEAPSQTRISDDSEQTSHTPEIKKKVRKKTVYLILVMALLLIASIVILFRYLPGLKREPAPPSIAVLAFEDRSPTRDQEYLGDGMAEEIINILSALKSLKVIARRSAFQFKGQNIDVREVGKQLEVAHILEGSIMMVDDRLRITVQLVETSEGTLVWSEVYDRDMTDIFEIQNSIASLVVQKMQSEFLDDGQIQPVTIAAHNVEAYNLNLKGEYFLHEHMDWAVAGTLQKAMESFKLAITLDENYADPYAGLAYALLNHVELTGPNNAFNPLVDSAKRTVARALELNKNLAKAHIVDGIIHLKYDWDWAGAEEAYARGVELQPKNSWVRFNYPYFLNTMERYDESLDFIRESIELDPVSTLGYSQLSITADLAGKPGLGGEMVQMAQQLDPESMLVIGITQSHYSYLKDREGLASLRKKFFWSEDMTTIPSFFLSIQMLGLSRMGDGHADELQRYLSEFQRRYEELQLDHYYMFVAYMSMGDFDSAIACLEKAYAAREALLVHLRYHWMFESIRADRRFQDIVQRIDRGGP